SNGEGGTPSHNPSIAVARDRYCRIADQSRSRQSPTGFHGAASKLAFPPAMRPTRRLYFASSVSVFASSYVIFAEHRSSRPKTPSDFLKVHSRGLLCLRVEIYVVFHPLDLLFLPIPLDVLSCCFFDGVWLFADPNFIIAIFFLPILLDFHRMIILGNGGSPFVVEVEEGPERIPTPNVAGLAPCPSPSTTEPCSESPSSRSSPGSVTDLEVELGIGSQIRRKVDRFRSGLGGRSSILAHSRSRLGDLCRVSNLSMGKG
ncbi:hypothetical protein U1Q18_010318, partial [Sarracenia purpurea var. burkii]